MFLLPLLLLWVLALGLAGGALQARAALAPRGSWRQALRHGLLTTALVLVGLVVWSGIVVFSADSLW
ncbi:hypothetical protein Q5H92_00145 [Hymenobacter sp. M29]|uniref:Uncharacterized protein n=1 Tax=Hymenobacter mellowenesis TaxID=3063995 RepID=A0ABT9A4H6_9BACT|nr:hypothetical protein [Hymenobacter sp. M29]MDO7844748.1 hypothetical protein [Hymenobacter sp. M29]